MRHGDELRPIEEERLLELVGDAKIEPPVARLQPVSGDAHVFVGVRRVAEPGRLPVAHFAATEEVGEEVELRSVPRDEEGAGRRFAIELFDFDRTGEQRRLGSDRGSFSLQDSRGPEHADDIGAGAIAEAERDVGRRG